MGHYNPNHLEEIFKKSKDENIHILKVQNPDITDELAERDWELHHKNRIKAAYVEHATQFAEFKANLNGRDYSNEEWHTILGIGNHTQTGEPKSTPASRRGTLAYHYHTVYEHNHISSNSN